VSAELSWQDWKFQYGVAYNCNDEDTLRQQVYETNVQTIEDHNAKGETWTMAVNSFGDRTHDEFVALVSTTRPLALNRTMRDDTLDVKLAEASLASSIDWVQRGVFNPIREQQSSDCWAHSAVGVLESNWAIATGTLPKIAEQQLCDCSNSGTCRNGGDEDAAV